MDLTNRVIDARYRVVGPIGAGGMAEVFEGVHLATERAVAIKVLSPECAAQEDTRVRFDREARAAGRIGHDNICEVTDVGALEDGSPYLVMPLLRGRTLAAVLRETGPLPLPRTIDLVAQILSAVAAAHAAGIVHRDLKPDNVFLTRMGDRDDFVKVLDFGISKFVGPETDAAVTQTGMVVGTPYYMSPEQARGAKDLDARVDVYAAGVILFQMLTGRLPYVGESYNEIIGAILLDPFPSPSDLRPDVPPAIESVILRATARERSVRYADARALREALAEAAGGISRPPSIDPLAAGPTIAVPSTPAPAPDDIGSQRTVAAGSTGGAGRSAPPAAEPHVPSTRSATARGVATPAFPLGDRTSVSARRRKAVAAVLVIAAAVGVLVFVFADPTAGGRAGPGAPAAGGVPESTAASATDPRPAATPAPVVIPVPVVAPPPLPAAPAPPAGDASNEAASPTAGTVRIALAGLPEGARVEVDGAEVEGPVLDLPRGDAEVEIRIAADGWIDWSARVVPSGDREIVYDGRRAEPPGTRPPRRDAGTRPPPDAGAALPGFGEGP